MAILAPFLLKIYQRTMKMMQRRQTFAAASHCICNFLQIGRGRPVDIMVPPDKVKNLESDLSGLSYSIMIPDVQKLIDLEKMASSSAGHKHTAGNDVNG
jgi:hypothetical protein